VKLKKSHQINVDDPNETAAAIVEMERKGKVRQSMLNYLKGEQKLKIKARLAIQDAHFSYGVLKVRHASDFEEHPNAGEKMLDDDGEEIKDPETGEPMVYPDELPINKRYETMRIHPEDFLFDEDAGPLDDSWSFVAQRIKMTKEDALADKRFKKKVLDVRWNGRIWRWARLARQDTNAYSRAVKNAALWQSLSDSAPNLLPMKSAR